MQPYFEAVEVVAHPRVGGENPKSPSNRFLDPGSSPRGRGKQSCRCVPWVLSRLIPAWAGKTAAVERLTVRVPAHPRVGGENAYEAVERRRGSGSSPRGRGKPQSILTGRLWPGLIPAWAGKTSAVLRNNWRSRAHPRVGGENILNATKDDWREGSSPRGRGKPPGDRADRPRGRLIPAWAGKTLPRAIHEDIW